MRVGLHLYEIDAVGAAHIYPLAGSFVAYLIRDVRPERFRTLYLRTPLRPLGRDAGSPEGGPRSMVCRSRRSSANGEEDVGRADLNSVMVI